MYTERFSIDVVCGVLITAMESRRPGLGAWSPATRDALREVFDGELARIEERFFEVFDDKAYFARLKEVALETCFSRYCAAAEKQTNLEQHDYKLWRGGDLLARAAYMAGGLLFGIILVKTPFIPIPETWDFLILATMLGGPFLPDAQVAIYKRRYAKALKRIIDDVREAEEARKPYEPLPTTPLERSETVTPPEQTTSETDSTTRTNDRSGLRER